jgi:hypothetical protein
MNEIDKRVAPRVDFAAQRVLSRVAVYESLRYDIITVIVAYESYAYDMHIRYIIVTFIVWSNDFMFVMHYRYHQQQPPPQPQPQPQHR